MTTYRIEHFCFPEMTTYRKAEWGDITIGGDRGDVHIECAGPEGKDVYCSGVTLSTSEEPLTEDEICDRIREVVEFSYASIGSDTFIGKDRF